MKLLMKVSAISPLFLPFLPGRKGFLPFLPCFSPISAIGRGEIPFCRAENQPWLRRVVLCRTSKFILVLFDVLCQNYSPFLFCFRQVVTGELEMPSKYCYKCTPTEQKRNSRASK